MRCCNWTRSAGLPAVLAAFALTAVATLDSPRAAAEQLQRPSAGRSLGSPDESRAPTLARDSTTETTPGRTRVPILMYHVIGDPPAGAAHPDLYVRTADFADQLRWLERHGYHPVTQRQVWDHWRAGAPLPRKAIVLSFDDGYRSTAELAFPPMQARNWPGVVNLKVRSLELPWGLRPRRVRRMIAAGWEIDAHTITHPDLTTLDDRRLATEVTGSRAAIQRHFGVPVDFFCYPSGRYDTRVIAAVQAAGYLGATTTIEGLADPDEPFTLRRVRVSRSDGSAGLAAKLELLSTLARRPS